MNVIDNLSALSDNELWELYEKLDIMLCDLCEEQAEDFWSPAYDEAIAETQYSFGAVDAEINRRYPF